MKFSTVAVGTGVDTASGGVQVIITIATGITVGFLGIITTTITILRRHHRRAVPAIILLRPSLVLRATILIMVSVRRVPTIIGITTSVPIVPIGIKNTSQANRIAPIWIDQTIRRVPI